MTGVWALAALWFGLARIASLVSIWFRGSTALTEIIIGIVAQLTIGAIIGSGVLDTNDIWVKFRSGTGVLGTDDIWVKFLSGAGAILLTFLAGAELDPSIFKRKWKEATTVGLASFFFPFLGCATAAHYFLGWGVMPSWLAGIAMSTTSAAIVYAVTLEFGFNTTEYGKTILVACFVTDLMSVVALDLIFAPITKNPDIPRGCRRGLVRSPLAHPSPFQEVWRPAFRDRDKISAFLPSWNGSARRLGRQRSGPSRLSHRNGACRNRR
jgi:glutathione-regulated potassium-efflux system ancillary protein KefC